MAALNYNHLRYFWMVAKTGSIVSAAAQLHLTPHSISGQLKEFKETLGIDLFRRNGRKLELTEEGRSILVYAERIFSTGEELLEVLRDQKKIKMPPFRVGIADSVSKLVAYLLVKPALALKEPIQLICREGRLSALLAELAIHRLDLIIADRPMPNYFNVRGFNHLLGESTLSVFGSPSLIQQLTGGFPALLNEAPLLLPGEDVAIRPKLMRWLETNNLHPQIMAEFDDSALMKAFGQASVGLFFAPTEIAEQVCEQYHVVNIGRIDTVLEQIYAISTERRLTHPAIIAISQAAKQDIFSASTANLSGT